MSDEEILEMCDKEHLVIDLNGVKHKWVDVEKRLIEKMKTPEYLAVVRRMEEATEAESSEDLFN